MDILFFLFFIFLGGLATVLYFRERKAKLMVRTIPAISATVAGIHKATSENHDRQTSYEIKIIFNVLKGSAAAQPRSFATQEEAEEWASQFEIGKQVSVKVNPLNNKEVFLPGEENQIRLLPLILGIVFITIGLFMLVRELRQ